MVSPTWEERLDGMLHTKRYCHACFKAKRLKAKSDPKEKVTKIKIESESTVGFNGLRKRTKQKSKTIGQAGIEKAREMLSGRMGLKTVSNCLQIEEEVIAKALGLKVKRNKEVTATKTKEKPQAVQISNEAQALRTELDLSNVRQPDKTRRRFFADCSKCGEEFRLPANHLNWNIQNTTVCLGCRFNGEDKSPVIIDVPAKSVTSIAEESPKEEREPEKVETCPPEPEPINEQPEFSNSPYEAALRIARADQQLVTNEIENLKRRLGEFERKASSLSFVVRSIEELLGKAG